MEFLAGFVMGSVTVYAVLARVVRAEVLKASRAAHPSSSPLEPDERWGSPLDGMNT